MSENIPHHKERASFKPDYDTHSAWLSVDADGEIKSNKMWYCYAPLISVKSQHLYLFFGGRRWKKNGINQWLDWLFNRSFFADAFLTKTADEAKKYGVAVDTSKDWAYVLGSIMVLRHPFEFTKVFTWFEFVELGLSEEDAFVAACNVFDYDGHLYEVQSNRNHYPVYGCINYSYYLGEHFKPAKSPFSKGRVDGCRSISSYHWCMDDDFMYRSVSMDNYKLNKVKVEKDDPFAGSFVSYQPETNLDNLKKIVNYYKEL